MRLRSGLEVNLIVDFPFFGDITAFGSSNAGRMDVTTEKRLNGRHRISFTPVTGTRSQGRVLEPVVAPPVDWAFPRIRRNAEE